MLENVLMKAGYLHDNYLRIFAILGEAFHHGTEEGLGQAGGTVKRFFDSQLPGFLRAFDLRPQPFEEHAIPRVRVGCDLHAEWMRRFAVCTFRA
jgi:hypothetical protein